MKRRLGTGASPTREQANYAKYVSRILHNECALDPDRWALRLGYHLYRSDLLDTNTLAVLRSGRMYLRPGLGRFEEILAIAHEHCHDKFHPECIAYRDLDLFQIDREEAQANTFATLCLYPSLEEFDTEDEFRAQSVMSERLTELRLAFKRKHGW